MKDMDLSYQESISQLSNKWLYFPKVVSIETLCLCNAKCDFCPQETLKRKGSKLSFTSINKIISDLKDFSVEPQFFNLSRVNEPFLDSRIFDIAKKISKKFKDSKFNWFTNASLLGPEKLDKLFNIGQINDITISLNEYSEKEYKKLMKLDFYNTINNIKSLHEYMKEKKLTNRVSLSRVGDNSDRDNKFIEFCKNNFPLFSPRVVNRFDWMGKVTTKIYSNIPNYSCSQWFRLHILSDGIVAFCAVDSEGEYGGGNIFDQHIIRDFYNSKKWLDLRKALPMRKRVGICKKCTAFA